MEQEFIDLRSDTVTLPTEEMLDAMRAARAGDDVYDDDPTVRELEESSSEILGKDDSIFVPSGTFGNQLAILTHAGRGDEVLISEDNHIVLYEAGASAVIAGVQLRHLAGKNGIIDMDELQKKYRTEDIHYPHTALICMENAHTNGTVVPLKNMAKVHGFGKKHSIKTHLDGARIFNAAIALGTSPAEIAALADSVMFCFSKGLCAPIGSVVSGSRDFIKAARKNRKMMGGGMRQAGYIAAPCIVALNKMTARLKKDHENARYLAERLEGLGFFEVFKNQLDINMVFFCIDLEKKESIKFTDNKFIEYLYNKKIKINPYHEGQYRFVTHYYINREKIDYVIDTIKKYMENIL
jgi:threonine aldolase